GGVCDRRQRITRHAEGLEQHRVPIRRPELCSRGGRWIGRKFRAESITQKRVNGAQAQPSLVERPPERIVVLKQPSELAGGEVRVERHATTLANGLSPTVGLEPV